jgi:hypothetical protein
MHKLYRPTSYTIYLHHAHAITQNPIINIITDQ